MSHHDSKFLADRIEAKWRGMEITIWNSVTVKEHHNVGPTQLESEHTVLAGDGSSGEKPEFVTPAIADKFQVLDVYPNVRIVDPTDDEVTVL